jgi:DNA processing protein
MSPDHAIALSLADNLSRVDLTRRLQADDPELLERAAALSDQARAVRERAAADGIRVLAWNEPHFPVGLLAIPDCPPAIWYRGRLECFDAPSVAIVGSRHAAPVSLETAQVIAADLAARGVTIVSGLARGVDSAAHRGALRSGRTAAVLGSGVDRIYPREHADLAVQVAANGIVLSEYPPGVEALPFHFPMRNRLISGLSRAIVVIEAGEKSGSLITAACALEQGRDVMAVPGTVLSGRNRGGHALIRDGARIVECAADVLEELGLATGPAAAAAGVTARPGAAAGDPVLDAMAPGCMYDVDELAASSRLDAPKLLTKLADFELRGLIRRIDGGRFVRL